MNVYLIERTDYVEYDQSSGHVVVANDEYNARLLAQGNFGNYEPNASVWESARIEFLGPYQGECEHQHIVLTDFNAG